jgi:hypothetical protein
MAITKLLSFQSVLIASSTGTGPNTYTLHLTDSAEVTLEPVVDTVDDGQSLASAFDVSFAVNILNTAVLDDPFVYKDSAEDPVKARIIFNGVTGGQSLNVENVIINGTRAFDGNRLAIRLTGSKRVTNASNGVIVP